jgi:hypothetical protein
LRDSQAAEEKAANDAFTKGMSGWSLFTSDGTFQANRDKALADIATKYRGQMQALMQSVPMDAPLDFDQTQMMFVPKTIQMPGAAGVGGNGFFAGSAKITPMPSGQYPVSTPQSFFVPKSETGTPLTPRGGNERRVRVRFPNGAEAEIPESNLGDAQTRLGAEVIPPAPTAFTNPGGAPGAVMAMRQFFTR